MVKIDVEKGAKLERGCLVARELSLILVSPEFGFLYVYRERNEARLLFSLFLYLVIMALSYYQNIY